MNNIIFNKIFKILYATQSNNKDFEEQIREIFNEYDRNENGFIEASELKDALAKCFKDPLFKQIVVLLFCYYITIFMWTFEKK